MAYSGKRIPRDNDKEKWKIFFDVNPKRRKEFKDKWAEIRPPKKAVPKKAKTLRPTKEVVSKNPNLMTSGEKRTFSNLVGTIFWSELLGASMTVTRVDVDRDIVNVRINKLAKLTVEEFASLPMEHYGADLTNTTGLKKMVKRQADYFDEETINAFRQFKDFLARKQVTPMREWVEKNLK